MNIYRGCTHGCIYCDSRSKCYQFTHPFEDIEVKQNAPMLLEAVLDKHFPGLKQKYIETYGNAYDVPSPNSKALYGVLRDICRENNMMYKPDDCFAYMNEFPDKCKQISLFD